MKSKVVKLHIEKNGIATIHMEDRESKNAFTEDLVSGLEEAFDQINKSNKIKVVIIQGYEKYFCLGGTKKELLKMYNKEREIVGSMFFKGLIECAYPTIAAMQGHAICGGLAFAMYADFLIFSEESYYAANFIQHGSTPVLGITYTLPLKLGQHAANHLLFAAEKIKGRDLPAFGVNWPVVPSKDVITAANDLALKIAENPRDSLMLIKKQLNKKILEDVEQVLQEELGMFMQTFFTKQAKELIDKMDF